MLISGHGAWHCVLPAVFLLPLFNLGSLVWESANQSLASTCQCAIMWSEWSLFTLTAPGYQSGNVAMLSLPELHRHSVAMTGGETEREWGGWECANRRWRQRHFPLLFLLHHYRGTYACGNVWLITLNGLLALTHLVFQPQVKCTHWPAVDLTATPMTRPSCCLLF